MTSSKPLGLTDSQFSTLINAADHVAWSDRSAFMRTVAEAFAGRSEVADGEFARAVFGIQARYFKPPAVVPHGPIRARRSKLRSGAAIE